MRALWAGCILAFAIFGRVYERAALPPAPPLAALPASTGQGSSKIANDFAATRRPPRVPPAVERSSPSRPLPMLASIGRVRVEVGRDRALVTEDVNLPRGPWKSGGVDLYVAYGAPGAPIALDAHLVAAASGSSDARLDDPGVRLVTEAAPRRPASVAAALGRREMAGVVVRVPELELRRAYVSSDLAIIRIRSLGAVGGPDPRGARDVVARLGADAGAPMTLYRIQLAAMAGEPKIARAEAALCGPEADPWPLSVTTSSRPVSSPADLRPPIAPMAAARHASDDLCIRWWN